MTSLADLDLGVLSALIEESACRSVLSKYPAGLDWLDEKLLQDIYWPEARIDFGPIFFQGIAKDFVPIVIGIERRYPRRQHMFGNFQITVNGVSATAEACAVNHVIGPGLESDDWASEFSWGRYLFTLEKRQKEWRISSMVFLLETQQRFPYDRGSEIEGLNQAENLSPEHAHYAAR